MRPMPPRLCCRESRRWPFHGVLEGTEPRGEGQPSPRASFSSGGDTRAAAHRSPCREDAPNHFLFKKKMWGWVWPQLLLIFS